MDRNLLKSDIRSMAFVIKDRLMYFNFKLPIQLLFDRTRNFLSKYYTCTQFNVQVVQHIRLYCHFVNRSTTRNIMLLIMSSYHWLLLFSSSLFARQYDSTNKIKDEELTSEICKTKRLTQLLR